MAFERWGSLSVSDHVDTAALAADVLLYDRLIVPVMTPGAARQEREHWVRNGWDPELQDARLQQLGKIAVRRPWNDARQQSYQEEYQRRRAELEAEGKDAARIDAFGLTRRVLAQEQIIEKPPHTEVQVIPAYHSAAGLQQDFKIETVRDHLAAQAVLLTRRLAVFDLPDAEKSLSLAIELSTKDEAFRARRAALFEWQEGLANRAEKPTPEAVVTKLSEMADAYNQAVLAADRRVRWKLAFMVCGIGVAFVSGWTAGVGVSAALTLAQFYYLDGKPAVEAGDAKPAAMFHDIEETIGAKLRAPAPA